MGKKITDTLSNIEITVEGLLNGCDILMLDDERSYVNEASGEQNPRHNASAHFLFGGRARNSARDVLKKREYLNSLEAKIQAEEENNGAESSKLIGLRKGLRKAEAELATAQWLWEVDVTLYNTMLDPYRAWCDGKVWEDLGSDWYSMICDEIMDRKVLAPQPPTDAEIAERMAEKRSRIRLASTTTH